jgi:hypothetical protein
VIKNEKFCPKNQIFPTASAIRHKKCPDWIAKDLEKFAKR